jgi:hypothetical protein
LKAKFFNTKRRRKEIVLLHIHMDTIKLFDMYVMGLQLANSEEHREDYKETRAGVCSAVERSLNVVQI